MGVHQIGHRVGGMGPQVDELVVALAFGDDPLVVLLPDTGHLFQRFADDLLLLAPGHHKVSAPKVMPAKVAYSYPCALMSSRNLQVTLVPFCL